MPSKAWAAFNMQLLVKQGSHKNEDIWLEDFPYSAEELAFKEMSACMGNFCCWFMLHTLKCCKIQSKLRPEVTGFCTPGFKE